MGIKIHFRKEGEFMIWWIGFFICCGIIIEEEKYDKLGFFKKIGILFLLAILWPLFVGSAIREHFLDEKKGVLK